MSQVDRNTAWNLLGRGASALLAIGFVPVYTRFLGIEAYGLVGFFAVVVALSNLFDLGFSATVNRELARRTTRGRIDPDVCDLVRTLEIPYWAIGVLIAAAVVLGAPRIARWVHPMTLSAQTVRLAVTLMGTALAFQWPLSFYGGALLGLQKQKTLNMLTLVTSIVRSAGAALVLWKISPTILAFFLWQSVMFALQTFLLRTVLWSHLGRQWKARWRPELIRSVWAFAGGMTAVAVLGLLIGQLDRIVLSKMLNLADFGYYTVAVVLSGGLYTLVMPVFDASFPQFSNLAARPESGELKEYYIRASQVMALLVIPPALIMLLCSSAVLFVWTGDTATVAAIRFIVPLLALGTAINGLLYVPFALQLAHGWTRITVLTNLIALIIAVPLMLLVVPRYGSIGAACIWPAMNAFYLAVTPSIMHRRLLPDLKRTWYLKGVLFPTAAGLPAAVVGGVLLTYMPYTSRLVVFAEICFLYVAVLLSVAAATPLGRSRISQLTHGALFRDGVIPPWLASPSDAPERR